MESISQFYQGFLTELYRSAQELLAEPMPALPKELFCLYEKTGDRQVYDGFYLTRRKYLAMTGLLALAEKRDLGYVPQEHIEKLVCIMEEICQEECWAVPAHVNQRQADWRITADLFACETAQTLSELSDRLSGELPARIRKIVFENVEKRIFIPFFSKETPSFWWEVCDTNWNAVCAGAIGSACLHLLKEDKVRLESSLERVIKALTHYISGFSEDGISSEGIGYYTYGMTYFANFAQELYEYSCGNRDLFTGNWEAGGQSGRADKIFKIVDSFEKCFFRDGKIVCFSDDSSEDTYRLGLYCILAMHFPRIHFPPVSQAAGVHRDSCYRFAALKMDLLYTKRYMEEFSCLAGGRASKPVYHVFPHAQWYIANAASGAGFACKGGNNGEAHNHNDVGHFIYEKDKNMFLTDLGAGEYTKEYFGEHRYSILCNGSQGHSVPIINNANQCPGERYRCKNFRADDGGTVEMELQHTYPEGMLEKFIRKFKFDLQTGTLWVEDLFQFPQRGKTLASRQETDENVIESLITQIKPVITEQAVLLKKDGAGAVLTFDESSMLSIQVRKYIHKNHKGREEDVYAIQWQVAVENGTANSRFSVCCK